MKFNQWHHPNPFASFSIKFLCKTKLFSNIFCMILFSSHMWICFGQNHLRGNSLIRLATKGHQRCEVKSFSIFGFIRGGSFSYFSLQKVIYIREKRWTDFLQDKNRKINKRRNRNQFHLQKWIAALQRIFKSVNQFLQFLVSFVLHTFAFGHQKKKDKNQANVNIKWRE